MEDFFLSIRKFILSKILRKHYYRTGKCKACGKCCTKIYVKHFKHVIQDEEEFKKLQYMHRFYTYLKVIDKDETGLVFECQNLDPETHKCTIHKSRPGICRRYPQEELFSMGGALSDDCGYKMLPIVPFSKVMDKLSKKQASLTVLFFVLIQLGLPVFGANGFSDDFIKNFKTCSTYLEENSVNTNGTVFSDVKFFSKDKDYYCKYYQSVHSRNGTMTVNCKFPFDKVIDLYKTMNTNNPPYKYSYEAENLFNSFINNPEYCKTEVKTVNDYNPAVNPEYIPDSIKPFKINPAEFLKYP